MLFDFTELPARERYKLAVSCVVPRPIAWVVSQDAAGVVNAAPYSFFNVFSEDPVVLGIGCGPGKPDGKDTLRNIKALNQFTVCLVPATAAEAMNVTAVEFDAAVDELAEAKLTALPSAKIRPPRIAESPVAMECETFQLIPIGPHTLVLGKVLAMHVADDCVLDAAKHYVDTVKLGLIGRMHGRGWYARTTDRFEMPRMSVEEWAAKKARAAE
jgi:flavin reductase (DIM6/NTAB) family NADH-FMN oxidoreductase RutF